MASGFLNMWSF